MKEKKLRIAQVAPLWFPIDEGRQVRVYDPYVAIAFRDPASANRGNAVVPDLSARIETSIDDLIEGTEILLPCRLWSDRATGT